MILTHGVTSLRSQSCSVPQTKNLTLSSLGLNLLCPAPPAQHAPGERAPPAGECKRPFTQVQSAIAIMAPAGFELPPNPKHTRLSLASAATYGTKFKQDWMNEYPFVTEGHLDPVYM